MAPQKSIPTQIARGKLPKKEVLLSGVPKKFVTFAFFLFLVTMLIYIGLSFGYKSFLNSEIDNLEKAIDDLRFQISPDQQDNLIEFFSQVSNINMILENHVVASKLFPVLEARTHSKVAYTGMEINVFNNTVNLEGAAATYDDLVSQLVIYEETPEITRVVLNEAQRSGELVRFRLSLILAPGTLEF